MTTPVQPLTPEEIAELREQEKYGPALGDYQRLLAVAEDHARLVDELRNIDDRLARRPALSDLEHRSDKVERACRIAGDADALRAQLDEANEQLRTYANTLQDRDEQLDEARASREKLALKIHRPMPCGHPLRYDEMMGNGGGDGCLLCALAETKREVEGLIDAIAEDSHAVGISETMPPRERVRLMSGKIHALMREVERLKADHDRIEGEQFHHHAIVVDTMQDKLDAAQAEIARLNVELDRAVSLLKLKAPDLEPLRAENAKLRERVAVFETCALTDHAPTQGVGGALYCLRCGRAWDVTTALAAIDEETPT